MVAFPETPFVLPDGRPGRITSTPPLFGLCGYGFHLLVHIGEEQVARASISTFAYQRLGVSRMRIANLFVQPPFRGTGVSDALFDAIFRYAEAQKIPQLYLYVRPPNPHAEALCQRLGAFTKPELPHTYMWDAPFPTDIKAAP